MSKALSKLLRSIPVPVPPAKPRTHTVSPPTPPPSLTSYSDEPIDWAWNRRQAALNKRREMISDAVPSSRPLGKLDVDLMDDMAIVKQLAVPALEAGGLGTAIGSALWLSDRRKEAERQARIAEGGEVISPGDIGLVKFGERFPSLVMTDEEKFDHLLREGDPLLESMTSGNPLMRAMTR